MNLIHNMSAPTKSSVVVARGIHLDRIQVFSAAAWLPENGPDYLSSLCAIAGLGTPEDPLARLTEATRELLATIAAPAAAILVPAVRARPTADRLLTLAVLSRSSERLFLLSRTPRFTLGDLQRTIALTDAAFFPAKR